MSKSGSHGTLTVWLAKSERAATNPTTPEAEAVVAPVVVPPVGALVGATVVDVEVSPTRDPVKKQGGNNRNTFRH